jgi:hypothetical protein
MAKMIENLAWKIHQAVEDRYRGGPNSAGEGDWRIPVARSDLRKHPIWNSKNFR